MDLVEELIKLSFLKGLIHFLYGFTTGIFITLFIVMWVIL